eukprot:918946-Prorocentrum_minimum.AAC.1
MNENEIKGGRVEAAGFRQRLAELMTKSFGRDVPGSCSICLEPLVGIGSPPIKSAPHIVTPPLRSPFTEENYPALTGGWSGFPNWQLGFPGNPVAIEVGVTSTNSRPGAGSSLYLTELRNYRSCVLRRRPY